MIVAPMKISIAGLGIHHGTMAQRERARRAGDEVRDAIDRRRMSMDPYPAEVTFQAMDAGTGTAPDRVPLGKRTEGSTRKEIR